MSRKDNVRIVWFYTKKGGMVGVHPTKIKALTSSHLYLHNDHTYELDVERWEYNQKALVDVILGA